MPFLGTNIRYMRQYIYVVLHLFGKKNKFQTVRSKVILQRKFQVPVYVWMPNNNKVGKKLSKINIFVASVSAFQMEKSCVTSFEIQFICRVSKQHSLHDELISIIIAVLVTQVCKQLKMLERALARRSKVATWRGKLLHSEWPIARSRVASRLRRTCYLVRTSVYIESCGNDSVGQIRLKLFE